MNDQRGQATVELALLLPIVALILLAVVQVALIAGDQVLAVHAARAGARAVAVHPDVAVARSAATEAVGGRRRVQVRLGGDLRPGGLAEVSVVMRPRMLPILGRLLTRIEIDERLAVRVEGG